MDPATAFRDEHDVEVLMTDDQSFIGANLPYVVVEELVTGGWARRSVARSGAGCEAHFHAS
jgi:hypothetical protein